MRRSLFALIAAEVISSFGSLMTLVALPWFVLETTGSPEKMGVVLAAEAAPLVLFAIPSGRLAGRLGPRRTLLLCDAFWVPVVAAIPVLHLAGALSFACLIGLSFLAGVPWAARYGSQGALVPELVGEGPARVSAGKRRVPDAQPPDLLRRSSGRRVPAGGHRCPERAADRRRELRRLVHHRRRTGHAEPLDPGAPGAGAGRGGRAGCASCDATRCSARSPWPRF